jgi:hypothetical protein
MFENIASWALSLSLIIFNIKLAGCPKLLASETKLGYCKIGFVVTWVYQNKIYYFICPNKLLSNPMDHSPINHNFELNKSRQKFHHSLKEHAEKKYKRTLLAG